MDILESLTTDYGGPERLEMGNEYARYREIALGLAKAV